MPSPEYSVELDLGEPPPEVMSYARKNIGEDPDTRLRAISDLKDLIYARGECIPHRMDDAFLLRFLRARMFIPERAHRLLCNYYRFKEENPDLFADVDPLGLRFIGDANVLAVPPYRDQTGRRLMIYRIGCWDPSVYSVDEIFKATILALELGVLEQRVQILGGVAIFDLEDINMQHAFQITPNVASRMVKLIVTAFPCQTHAIHIVNNSWVFDKMFNLFKPLLNRKMKENIHFHGSKMKSLHQHIIPECLPERYGGVQPDYSYNVWLESLRMNKDIVREMVLQGYKVKEKDLPGHLRGTIDGLVV